MTSKLLLGNVWHARPGKQANAFRYRVLYLAVDLAELDDLGARLRLLGHNAHRPYSINDRDHIGAGGGGLVQAVRSLVRELSPSTAEIPITLVTQPSMLGYAFNPVSFFVVGDTTKPDLVIAEVHNRRSERYAYPLFPQASEEGLSARFPKEFYVSPFLPMEASYRFSMSRTSDGLSLGFDLVQGDDLLLATGLDLTERPLTDTNLARALVTYPLVPQKTLAMIYWQALKLRLKGAKYHRPPTATPKEDAHVQAR